MTTLPDFLLARLAEDKAAAGAVDDLSVDVSYGGEPRWSPARVLADVEAKRRIVQEALGYGLAGDPHPFWDSTAAHRDAYSNVLLALAQPYADHPDFREEWRTTATTPAASRED